MKLNYKDIHKDFKLNDTSFATASELLAHTAKYSDEIHDFLKDWFSNKEYIIANTSGSTGAPKAIKLKKKQLQNSALATGDFFKLKEKTSALLCLPTAYIAGKMMLVRALTLGWHIEVGAADAYPLKENLTSYDFAAMVPLQLENSIDKIYQIKKLIVGGGAVSNSLQEKLQKISTEVFATYGMTETITHIAIKKLNNFVPFQGARVIKQPLQKEYYKTLPNTKIYKDERDCLVIKNTSISDTIIFTTDVVALISDTQFEWLGRFDNVINSGGIKLHPEKIEGELSKIISQRFFVAGIKDDKLGEKLVLLIELADNKAAKLRDKLTDAMKNSKRLSKFEIPREMYFVNRFVETDTKKIQRKKTMDLIKGI
jgi:O-succinylbenzoic acid--CoA ligase